jgi:hypothetical protein
LLALGAVVVNVWLADPPAKLSDPLRAALSASKEFDGAQRAVEGAQRVAWINTLVPATNHGQAFAQALAVTLVAAAVSSVAPARAVFWPWAMRLSAPAFFQSQAAELERGRLPLDIWVRVACGERRSPDGSAMRFVVTYGVYCFCLREIELGADGAVDFDDLKERVREFARQAITRGGGAFANGSAFGLGGADRFRVELAESTLQPGVSIFRLLPENIVPGLKAPKASNEDRA